MFTGIVEEIGIVERIVAGKITHLVVRAQNVLAQTRVGDSINVNGVCLTVVELGARRLAFDVIQETCDRSNIGQLTVGEGVNLERAMSADGRFGGHIVSGHIDGVGAVLKKERQAESYWITIAAPASFLSYVVTKGSVAIDGVSLTVVDADRENFSVAVIPHTLKHTTLGFKDVRDTVNLEADILGKYVFRYLSGQGIAGKDQAAGIQKNYLKKMGFIDE